MGARWTNSKRNWRTSIFRFRYVNTYAKTNGIIKPCKTRSFQKDERKVCIELTEQGKDLQDKACSLPTTMATNLGITEQEYRSFINSIK